MSREAMAWTAADRERVDPERTYRIRLADTFLWRDWIAEAADRADSGDVPPDVAEIVTQLLDLDDGEDITVDGQTLARLVEWAQEIPGWDDGIRCERDGVVYYRERPIWWCDGDTTRWEFDDLSGESEEFYFPSDTSEAEIKRELREWLSVGNGDPDRTEVYAGVATSEDGDRVSVRVVVQPDEPECDYRSGHAWIQPEPAWGSGPGVVYEQVCPLCGIRKSVATAATDPWGERYKRVEYDSDEVDSFVIDYDEDERRFAISYEGEHVLVEQDDSGEWTMTPLREVEDGVRVGVSVVQREDWVIEDDLED